MQVHNEPGRSDTSQSYMCVMRTGELEKTKGVTFNYAPSRSSETAKSFLSGFKGILVTDGYEAYKSIPDITHAECWAHMRRYFYESVPLLPDKKMDQNTESYRGLDYCNKLFKIEEKIALLSVKDKLKERQEKSKIIVDEFFEWVNTTLATKIIVNYKLKKALTYAQNQRKELSEFLNDAIIPLSNNLAERCIRPFTIGRKNWLFADTPAGAKANATFYSLIESAKLNNLNIYKYLKYLLEELPNYDCLSDDILEKFLPWSETLPDEICNFQGSYEELKASV